MRWNTLVVVFILTLGLFLKLHRYAEYPQRGATSDEYTYSFLGLSLLNDGIPASWSYFSPYTNRYDLTLNGTYFPIVTPYFDHPPLFGLLVGGWAKLFDEHAFDAIRLQTIRLVPIVLSSFSAIVLYLLSVLWYRHAIALLALIIFSVAPLFVIHHRVVLAENFLTLLLLLSLYLYERFKKRLTVQRITVLGVLAGASLWTKEIGVSVFLTLLLLFLLDKKRNGILLLSGVFVSFLLAYVVYGYAYDGELFWKILSLQSMRDVGPQTLWYLLSTPVLVNKIYYDGWYTFGLLSILLLLKDKRHMRVTTPFLIYFLILVTTLTQRGQSGWYLIPLFPFLSVASAVTIQESKEKRNLFFIVFVFIIGMFLIQELFVPLFGLAPKQFRFLSVFLLAPMLFFTKKNIFAVTANLWIIMLLLGSALATFLYRHPV